MHAQGVKRETKECVILVLLVVLHKGVPVRKFLMSILVIVLVHPAFAVSTKTISEVKVGKDLYLRILARHSKLDKFYQSPDLFGGLTDSPKVTIYVPVGDWKKLSAKEQDLLASYVSSLVGTVTANPLTYARVPESAPAAQQIRSNALRMNDRSWQIIAGQLSPDGRDIMADSTVRTGGIIACQSEEIRINPEPKTDQVKPISKYESDILARKLAVATYYQQILKNKYMMAVVSVQGSKEEILQISLIRVTDDQCNLILNSGLYNEARKAEFVRIDFVDINQEKHSFTVR